MHSKGKKLFKRGMIGVVPLALDATDRNFARATFGPDHHLLIVAKRGIEPPRTRLLLCERTLYSEGERIHPLRAPDPTNYNPMYFQFKG